MSLRHCPTVPLGTAEIKGQTIMLPGTQSLSRVAGLTLKLSDGRSIVAERNSWGTVNSETYQDWAFSGPVTTGTLVAEMYDGLETVQQPIRLVIGKPY